MAASKAALVTGTSSGIGRATAIGLRQAGYHVYATARRVETLTELAELGIVTLPMDVTDEASMDAVVKRIVAEHGWVGVLVNNAGFELAGTVEETPLEEVRRQFDTNVFGLIRLTQLVLPGMRQNNSSRIVNVSSIFGRFAVPGKAFYDASKFAVAGFTEALRLEVAGFGIGVALVEPAATRTACTTTPWSPGTRRTGPTPTSISGSPSGRPIPTARRRPTSPDAWPASRKMSRRPS